MSGNGLILSWYCSMWPHFWVNQGGVRQKFAEGMPKICFGHLLVPTCKFFPKSQIFSSIFLGPTKFFPKMQIFSTENLGPTNFFPKMENISYGKFGTHPYSYHKESQYRTRFFYNKVVYKKAALDRTKKNTKIKKKLRTLLVLGSKS